MDRFSLRAARLNHAAGAVVVGGFRSGIDSGGVNASHEPAIDTVRNVVAKLDIGEDWISASGGGGISKDAVIGVLDNLNGVGVIWRDVVVDLRDQILVEEELTRVGDVATSQGVVCKDGGTDVGNGVNVRSATGVVAREDALEASNAILISLLNAAQSSVVQVGKVVGVAVTRTDNTRIHASGVAAMRY